MQSVAFDEHIARLRARLAGPLPGTAAQLTMAPRHRQDPRLADVRGKRCREAGVLVLLFPLEVPGTGRDTPAVLLTVRRSHLNHHAGQVSFPGGRREPGETLRETALRETHEEVGLPPDAVDVLGPLTPLYIPPSRFCVHPFVGITRHRPALRPHDAEVADVLAVPLAHLLDPATRRRAPRLLHGQAVEVPFFAVNGYEVWGATAMMLAELLALFAPLPDPARAPTSRGGQ
ncbi:CoA pyrophosphatase [Rhodocaloribacter litoris]|uniref:NUDIX hydrolase n=1 Tax=Rhodocaloribacter litoris TaxID=2558931 RepID=UPI001420E367|nr:CoA pyrophosphatase [Rhodocaloribacter litoris]QXD14268.1 CoA pyrophosphatase [Rhodocaloribacter litoris]